MKDTPALLATSGFPGRARLETVLAALTRRLPATHAVLVAAEELADGREALAALADQEIRHGVVAALDDAEADWMAARMLAAWARIAEPELDPAACLSAPDEVWCVRDPTGVHLTVHALGLAPDWTVRWPDEAMPDPDDDGRTATIMVPAPTGSAPAAYEVTARVIGHLLDREGQSGGRELLYATANVTLRRPVVLRRRDGMAVAIRDHTGASAAGLAFTVGGHSMTVPASGMIEFDTPLPPGSSVESTAFPSP